MQLLCYATRASGHSLGGAVATLAAADFTTYFRDPIFPLSISTHTLRQVHLMTFGSPRVGDKAFVQAMRTLMTAHTPATTATLVAHRYVNVHRGFQIVDIASLVPVDGLGYYHFVDSIDLHHDDVVQNQEDKNGTRRWLPERLPALPDVLTLRFQLHGMAKYWQALVVVAIRPEVDNRKGVSK